MWRNQFHNPYNTIQTLTTAGSSGLKGMIIPGLAHILLPCVYTNGYVFSVADEEMVLDDWERIIQYHWKCIFHHFKNAQFDKFIVILNHQHGIIWINNNDQIVEAKYPCH